MSDCKACGRGVAGLKSALRKQKSARQRMREKLAAVERERDAYREARSKALQQRDEMATALLRSRRREAALTHAMEQLRFQHERLQEQHVKLTGAVFGSRKQTS